ncbi:hypothetical protein SDC9_176408 [bioreactor metagenome]|uniref:Uncharacterized protein n=1 Tax=bioreactor metagenome TaxID=1076179 RepID=A0A645GPX1_9ZZZZ
MSFRSSPVRSPPASGAARSSKAIAGNDVVMVEDIDAPLLYQPGEAQQHEEQHRSGHVRPDRDALFGKDAP